MQNKKDKGRNADAKKAAMDRVKNTTSGSADTKKVVTSVGKKGAQTTTAGKKGWKK
jgi:hypothetical protein